MISYLAVARLTKSFERLQIEGLGPAAAKRVRQNQARAMRVKLN